MAKSWVLGLSGLAICAAMSAGEIHGTVSDGGASVAKDTALRLECGSKSATAKTDEHGSYSLRVEGTGECRLSLEYKGSTPSLRVTVYDRPSRYDLVVAEEGGKPVLRRK
jgi:hypothetical protein